MRIGLSEREKINKKETRVKKFKSNIPQNHCETAIRPNKGPEIGMQLEQIHTKHDKIKGHFFTLINKFFILKLDVDYTFLPAIISIRPLIMSTFKKSNFTTKISNLYNTLMSNIFRN